MSGFRLSVEMNLEEGALLVSVARRAVEHYFAMQKLYKPVGQYLQEKRGVFVSIYTHPAKELRGCIGFVKPDMPLDEATARAALAAAFDDPRFPPMTIEELPRVVFEVSVLTPPVPVSSVSREELLAKIEVGKDGLVLETPYGSGLLLPQVPVEYGWNAEEYLSHLCVKAGLNPTYWVYGEMRLSKFRAEVFSEVEPRGAVVRRQ
ncbi:MAG: TIGR00296 family protein [Candidatus Caldarchaeum sp.]